MTSPDCESVYASFTLIQQHSQIMTTYDRIQFKNATANNSKRRVTQQYFRIIVELWADVSSSQSAVNSWVKIAIRISAPLIVRGRSPGHYSKECRSSSTSMGPGEGFSGHRVIWAYDETFVCDIWPFR